MECHPAINFLQFGFDQPFRILEHKLCPNQMSVKLIPGMFQLSIWSFSRPLQKPHGWWPCLPQGAGGGMCQSSAAQWVLWHRGPRRQPRQPSCLYWGYLSSVTWDHLGSPGITWDHLGLHENCLTFHCCLPFDPLPKLTFCHHRRKNKLQQTNVPDTHLKVAGR